LVPSAEVASDGNITAALTQLHRAVSHLIDPLKVMSMHGVHMAPSVWQQLLDAVPAAVSGERLHRNAGKSQPPVFCDAVDLQTTIDGVTAGWLADGDTPSRLRVLAARKWRPQDSRQVGEMAGLVESWVVRIGALVEPKRVKTISAPCPQCNATKVYRKDSAGESIRQAALQLVAETGCSCLACGAHWPPSRFLFLCRLLKFDLPAGVLA